MPALARSLIREVVTVAGELQPDWRASDRLALAEQTIWELLHMGSLTLERIGDGVARTVEREQWQPLLLDWATWAPPRAGRDAGAELFIKPSEH